MRLISCIPTLLCGLVFHRHVGFSFDPHLCAAGKRLIRAVDHGTRPMNHDFVALAVFLVRFDGEDGQVGAFGIGANVVLINVDSSFHLSDSLG